MREMWTEAEEAERLARRFDQDPTINQKEFAKQYSVPGGASMLTQHKKGHRPMNLEAAMAYARGFGVGLADISPRLAELVVSAIPLLAHFRDAQGALLTKWPFTPEFLAALRGADAETLRCVENGARAVMRMRALPEPISETMGDVA